MKILNTFQAHQIFADITGEVNLCADKLFKEVMSDASSSVFAFYKGNIAFINVIQNISTESDCDPKVFAWKTLVF